MYKYSYEILQELSTQRPTSKHRSSRCFSTKDKNEAVKDSLNPKDKQLKSYVLTKINKIQAEKQILLAKRRKALLWYRTILEKMVSPLIELLPDVASSRHLSKLTDFRTSGGYSEQNEETNNNMIIVRPKCVEEPLPILIKPEYKISKKVKKGWKIMSKLEKARDSKDEMLNKYKLWRDKVVKESEDQSKVAKSTEDKSPGLMVYELFLKDAVESKIENLIPTIEVKDEQSNLYDFRLQDEPAEHEQCESNISTDEKLVASSAKDTNSKFDKSIKSGKTVVTKLSNTKSKNNTDPVSVKAKLYDQSSLKKKNETVQAIKVPATHSKDENQVKQPTQRTLHKQNWAKNDNRVRSVKLEEVKDKPVVNKTIGILSKSKKPQVIQRPSNNSFSAENKTHNSTVDIEEKEAGKEVSNRKFSGPDNFVEPFSGKSNRPSSDLLQDGGLKVIENMLDEMKTSGINVITTENTDKNLKLECKEHKMNNSEGTIVNDKVETAVDGSLGKSDTVCDFKSDIIDDEKQVLGVSSTPQDDVGFAYERNVYPNGSQINNKNKISTIATESENKNTLGCELMADPGAANPLTTENTNTLNNNKLKTTYLVSFEVNDDEGFLKTRTQVVADKIIGDSIDLDTVLEEERKARERRKVERLPENANGAGVNELLDTSKSELQFHNKGYVPRSTDKNIDIKKVNISSAMEQDVESETPKNNIREINSFTSNSTYTDKYTQGKGSNISNNNSDKKVNDTIMRTTMLESLNINLSKDGNVPKNSDVIDSGINARQKKVFNKTQSFTPIGQEKKVKVNKNGKVVVLEKEKNVLGTKKTSDSKKLNIVNTGKTKELDRSEKYQEIINSVKNIIPSSNSNESTLERNNQKIVPAGTKTMNFDDTIKKYSNTINELKEIINELPRSDEKQAMAASKPRRLWTNENKKNNSSEGLYKTAKEENIALIKEKAFDTKQIGIQANKSKRINLKNIKIVDKIEKVNEELKPLSVVKKQFEETKQADQEKREGQLKLPKSNTFIDKKMASKSLDFLTKQKEYLEENSTILSLKNDNKINPLKQKTLSNLSDKNTETPSDEFFKRTSKAKSAINFKSKKIDNNSLESNKSKINDLPLASSGELLRKTLDKDPSKKKSGDKTNASLEENRLLVSATENNKAIPSKAEKIKLPIENFSKSAKNFFVNQKKVIKFTRELGLIKSNKSENNLRKTGGEDILSVNTVKGTPNRSMEVMYKQNPGVEVTPQKPSEKLSNDLKDINNSGSKVKKEMLQPTGTSAKRPLNVKVLSNVKPKRNIQSSQLDVSGNMLQKSGGENGMQVNSIERINEEPQSNRRLKNRSTF